MASRVFESSFRANCELCTATSWRRSGSRASLQEALRSLTTRTRPAISTLAMMGVATVVITLAASWPLLKPTVFHSLGITKKILDKG
jgi:hypothetical protein